MFGKLNKGKVTVKEGINTKAQEFVPLKTFTGETIIVDGFFFTSGDYGRQVVVVGNGYNINMPKRAVEQFEQIRDDDEMLQALLEGHLAIDGVKEIKTKNGKTVSYSLKDI